VIYPIAYLALTSSLTILLIVLGLAGHATLAAELGIVQGALLATFYAFSANTRSLILQGHGDLTPERLLSKRILALPLLCLGSYLLCVHAADIAPSLAVPLILRRACEWLAEVRLCELEVASDKAAARRVVIVQAAATLFAVVGLLLAPAVGLVALYAFALAPLLGAAPRFKRAAFEPSRMRETLIGVTPHIGSTAVIGVAIYLIRLLIFLLVDREAAGLLFTAFALGSFVATLFANVLGPTLALRRARSGKRGPGWAATAGSVSLAGAGILTIAMAAAVPPEMLVRPALFWFALGLSLIGGAIMIRALLIRLDLFDEKRGDLLFGPDVLRNLSLILGALAAYRLVGPQSLAGLYLLDAILTLFFYASVYWARPEISTERGWQTLLRAGIAAGLLFPLFIQLQDGVYSNPGALMLDSGGSLVIVPLPASLAAAAIGTVLLARYREAATAFGVVFFLFVGMVFATVVSTHGSVDYESRKLVLLFQYLVPTFALVLGQMYFSGDGSLRICSKAFLGVISAVVPFQLGLSLAEGESGLAHHLVLFTIYQHRQFAAVVFVCAYLLAAFVLWADRRDRSWILALAPLMGLYAAVSYSTLAFAFLAGGLAMLAVGAKTRAAYVCLALALGGAALGFYLERGTYSFQEKYTVVRPTPPQPVADGAVEFDGKQARTMTFELPRNVRQRFADWALYGRGIAESPRTVLFGHARPFERAVSTSAHNYYLDFIYNFGLLAFLPLLWLIAYTAALLWRARSSLQRELPLLGLAMVVVFLVLIDSNFKVTFRQPYPGLFGFFLWGLLISRLAPTRRNVDV
jgi:hypothetical protein